MVVVGHRFASSRVSSGRLVRSGGCVCSVAHLVARVQRVPMSFATAVRVSPATTNDEGADDAEAEARYLDVARRLHRRARTRRSRTRSARAAMRLHEWVFGLKSFREAHGMEGGDAEARTTRSSRRSLRGIGAVVMGRKMFSGGAGPWESDPNADGWWGDDPPFRVPVFVLTHHEREPLVMQGGTTFHFVTDGIELGARAGARRRRRQGRPRSPAARASSSSTCAAGLAGRVPDPRRAGLPGRRRPPLRRHRRLTRSSWKRRGWCASPAVTHLRFRVTAS